MKVFVGQNSTFEDKDSSYEKWTHVGNLTRPPPPPPPPPQYFVSATVIESILQI